MAARRLLLRQEFPDGRREVDWRLWVLIWLMPVLFLAASVSMLGHEVNRQLTSTPGVAEVVRVQTKVGETTFDRGKTSYSPLFRYVWRDGKPTNATTGMSHPDWNFEVGSRHDIRWFEDSKQNIILPGAHNWLPGLVIAAIGALLGIPAAIATWWLRRWLRAGT